LRNENFYNFNPIILCTVVAIFCALLFAKNCAVVVTIYIRITEAQFKKVAEALITERRNKSALVRKALDSYLKEKRDTISPENSNKNNTE